MVNLYRDLHHVVLGSKELHVILDFISKLDGLRRLPGMFVGTEEGLLDRQACAASLGVRGFA